MNPYYETDYGKLYNGHVLYTLKQLPSDTVSCCVTRKVLPEILDRYGLYYTQHTVTYCQYGDTRMKPTDIWTNCDIKFKPPCKNGDQCHERAPRGAKTGTQGLKGATERGVIPKQLMEDIFDYADTIFFRVGDILPYE
jgi:hypothetical protein